MRLYWCRTCGKGRNLGDNLGPRLLTHHGFRVTWADPAHAQAVAVGSVLSKMPPAWRGVVLGTGFIQAGMTHPLTRARVLAVRGELTRDACDLPRSTQLGDLGILVADLLGGVPERSADGPVTIAPHYVDQAMAVLHPHAARVDILAPARRVLAQIAKASLVYTSSLHALIAADALGVPHVLELSTTTGGLFKFSDYASAFGEEIKPGVVRLTDRGAMAQRQAELRALLPLVPGAPA